MINIANTSSKAVVFVYLINKSLKDEAIEILLDFHFEKLYCLYAKFESIVL